MFDHVWSCLILVDLSCSWNILINLGLVFTFWSIPGIYILEHSRNFILFWLLKKFNFCDHSRIFGYGPFLNCYVLWYSRIVKFWACPGFFLFSILDHSRIFMLRIINIFTFWSIQEYFSLDHSRLSIFWNIQELLCFRTFTSPPFWTIPGFLHSWTFQNFWNGQDCRKSGMVARFL